MPHAALIRGLFTRDLRRHPWRLLLSPHGGFKFVRKGMRREPPPSGAVGFWPAPVSGARHSLPLQFLAQRPMVTARNRPREHRRGSLGSRKGGCAQAVGSGRVCAGVRWKLASTPKCVRSLRSHLVLVAGHFYATVPSGKSRPSTITLPPTTVPVASCMAEYYSGTQTWSTVQSNGFGAQPGA